MKVPFWQPSREYNKYKIEFSEAIDKVLSNGELVLGYGKDIPEFEQKFAKFIGVKNAVMTGGGTHALYLAYKALLKPGDEVITVSHTFIATIDQIKAVGATPILVDIGEDGLIDPIEVQKAITPRTKAIVPVHLEGKVCNMASLWGITNKYNLKVIDDAAQAIGAQGIATGHVSCFSLFPAKILGSFGNAGCITTNDDELAERFRVMRCNGGIGKNPDIENADWGTQMEPDNLQAAVLNVKMKYLDERLARRKEIAEKYNEAFKNLPIKLPINQPGRVWQDYVIRVNVLYKFHLIEYLKENGIGVLGHNLIPNHWYKKLGLNFNLPKTETYIAEQIRIPCNPDLTDEEINYVIEKVNEFFSNSY